ncbi:MAG: hypothetical protein FWC68_05815, partial [Oscillospiraceae bacterium]|nr:hypothetical protein [Oscillospiraceae bacterium]
MNDNVSNKNVHLRIALLGLVVFIALFWGPYTARKFGFGYRQFVAFLIYTVFWVYVPGLAILKFLQRKKKEIDSALAYNIASFFVGFAYLILQYYIVTWMDIRFLLLIISPLTAAVLIYKNRKSYSYKYFFNSNNLMSEYGLITICTTLIGSIISLLWRFPQPHLVENYSLNRDFLWQIGNVNILSGSSNFSDSRVSQVTFAYHYFSNLFFAVHKILLEQVGLFQDDNLISFNLLMQYQFILLGL